MFHCFSFIEEYELTNYLTECNLLINVQFLIRPTETLMICCSDLFQYQI